MRRARYQNGNVHLKERRNGPAVWVYRFRERNTEDRVVRKSVLLGSSKELKTLAQAMRAADGLRSKVNQEDHGLRKYTFGALLDRFIEEEMPAKLWDFDQDANETVEMLDFTTGSSYRSTIKVHIRPRWGDYPIEKVDAGLIEDWLKRKDLAPKTKGNIKALMHLLFEKAMLWKMYPVGRNPVELVTIRGISKRRKRPRILAVEEFLRMVALIPEPYALMVWVAICTGMRVSEVLGLKWNTIDFENLSMAVRVSAVSGRLKRLKTEASCDELPLDPDFATMLLEWKVKCPPSNLGLVFPSPITDRPFHASPIQQDYIRKAAIAAGLGDGIGWHTIRHTYRSWLDSSGAPIGVQQRLMRHSHVATTMNQYGDSLMEDKRTANTKVVRMALRPASATAK